MDVPAWLDPAQPSASADEIRCAAEIRRGFLFENGGDGAPYVADIIRAFRLVAGASIYVEVGTFDKGNLAYAAGLLAADATLIDVDIESHPTHTARLEACLKTGQALETVVGDSSADETLDRVRELLKGREADVVFIDADHCAHSVFADYAAYAPLVRKGGLILFHDVYWRGDESTFGTSTALEQIDRMTPIHVVLHDDPVHRFLPWLGKQDTIWGGVALIRR